DTRELSYFFDAFYFCKRRGFHVTLLKFRNREVIRKQQPILRESKPQFPVADAKQIQFFDQIEFCLNGAGVFKPNLVLISVCINIIEKRCLCRVVIFNRNTLFTCKCDGLLRAKGARLSTWFEWKCTFVSIYVLSEKDFIRWYFSQCIFNNVTYKIYR